MKDIYKELEELHRMNDALLGSISATRIMNMAIMNTMNQNAMITLEWHAAR